MAPTTREPLCTNGFMVQRKNGKPSSDFHVITTKNAAQPGRVTPKKKPFFLVYKPVYKPVFKPGTFRSKKPKKIPLKETFFLWRLRF